MLSVAKRVVAWEGSYEAQHYLKSMNLPPVPGILELPPDQSKLDDFEG